jgi:hypothetical protein
VPNQHPSVKQIHEPESEHTLTNYFDSLPTGTEQFALFLQLSCVVIKLCSQLRPKKLVPFSLSNTPFS